MNHSRSPRPAAQRQIIASDPECRPESPGPARQASPRTHHNASGNHVYAWASHGDTNIPKRQLNLLRTNPRSSHPAQSNLNQTYQMGRHSDLEYYSSGDSDSRSGYESYDGLTGSNHGSPGPRYYSTTHDMSEYSLGGNYSSAGDAYPYGGNQTGSNYAYVEYDGPDVYQQWNSMHRNQSGMPSPHYVTQEHAYSDEPNGRSPKEVKKMVSLQILFRRKTVRPWTWTIILNSLIRMHVKKHLLNLCTLASYQTSSIYANELFTQWKKHK